MLYWIWFAHRPGLTDRMKVRLLAHFQDPESLYFADGDVLRKLEGLSGEAREGLLDKNLTSAREILECCQEKRIGLLTIRDAAYPARLKNIDDPPVLLYYKGILPEFDSTAVVGVVGTRKATAYGMTMAKRLGYQIGRCGVILVSGLAAGIDSQAMSGGLTAGTKVVGVLGCGPDVIYPQSSRDLYRDVERHGCILSEFAPGTPPLRRNFPRRNRIMSGLSCGVLVVEAPEKSGALITAGLALDQGRDVFVVPGNIDLDSCKGSNALLRSGATPVFSGWDVAEEYAALYPDMISRSAEAAALPEDPRGPEPAQETEKPGGKPRRSGKKQAPEENCHKKSIDNRPRQPYIDVNDKLPKLSAEEQAVVSTLSAGERQVDEVIAETGLSTGRLLAVLTMLELKGIISSLPGKRLTLRQQ